MKFTVDEINNSTSLLPGVQLGYEIYDSCFEPVVALQPSLLFLTQERSAAIDVLCNYTDYQPRVAAVIGPHTSDLCMATAKLFSFFLTPQVTVRPRLTHSGQDQRSGPAAVKGGMGQWLEHWPANLGRSELSPPCDPGQVPQPGQCMHRHENTQPDSRGAQIPSHPLDWLLCASVSRHCATAQVCRGDKSVLD